MFIRESVTVFALTGSACVRGCLIGMQPACYQGDCCASLSCEAATRLFLKRSRDASCSSNKTHNRQLGAMQIEWQGSEAQP